MRYFLIRLYGSPYFKYIRKITPWKVLIAWETAIFHITEDVALKCVGPGWHTLVRGAYHMINLERPFRVAVTQVKEKYGTLRIYMNGGSRTLNDIIEEITEQSATVCEGCGEPGTTRWDLGWVQTLCDACIDKLGKKDVV